MKHMKRSGIYQCSNYNCTFNPETMEAFSYKWFKFVARVEGVVIFNSYRYSNSTSKHQSKVRSLLAQLGVKVDVFVQLRKGIRSESLAEVYLEAEETECELFLIKEEKRDERNQRAREKRAALKMVSTNVTTPAYLTLVTGA